MSGIAFTKMHGLGNDFVIIDTRTAPLVLDDARARSIADRHTGVGCDQLILIEPPVSENADVFMRIRNNDGGEVGACGNATRCVAALLMRESGRDEVRIDTDGGVLVASNGGDALVTVDMGPPKLDWRDIPLAHEADTLELDLAAGSLSGPVAVSMGNPHAVFFVDDADAVPLADVGPTLEHHEMFPQRANIGVAQILDEGRMRLRVWERGAGITQACGTGACAAVVAANRRGLVGRRVETVLDGGSLVIAWREDGHVTMTGPVATAFTGVLNLA